MDLKQARCALAGLRSHVRVMAVGLLAAGGMFDPIPAAAQSEVQLPANVVEFLQQHCVQCHSKDSGESARGGLQFDTDTAALQDAEVRRRWILAYDRVVRSEMPPKSEPRPPADQLQPFLQSLSETLTTAESDSHEVILRRLNRTEYQNTVNDLFQTFVDLSTLLPDDTPEQGFDTSADGLSLSPEHMLLYVEAADVVLDAVLGPPNPPERIQRTLNIKDLPSKTTADRIDDDGVVLFSGAKTLPMYGFAVRGPSAWKLTIQAKALQTSRPVVMSVEGGVTGRIPGHPAGFYEVSPDRLTSIEVIDRAVENSDTFAFGLVGGFPWWSVSAETYKGAGLFIGDITVEGPVDPWPPVSRTLLLGGTDPAAGTVADVRTIVEKLLPRAFRRPVSPDEVTPFVVQGPMGADQKLPFETTLRRSLRAILCAPEFLFLEERPRPDDSSRIDDYALACRLSYFLWRSLPDEVLTSLAERDQLHLPEVLDEQVERLLNDSRSERFVQSFTDQWLRLREIDFTVPNEQLYPEYNQLLRQSMLQETRSFFREILNHDLSVNTFVDSDFAMLNGPLADFYGIPEVHGLEMRRVSLPSESLRGGVLTHASVLKVSADGTRTSPVLRGAWVLKHLYGDPPPPPPSSVTAIEPDIRGATTIREQLEKHRNDASCARCHALIDPPGFALESFDVIGGQRKFYRTAQGGKLILKPLHPEAPGHFVRYHQGPDVDASGTLSDGATFSDIREYRRLLLRDEKALPLAMARLLSAFSTGRTIRFSDRPEIHRIVDSAGARGFGLRTILHEVARCRKFRQR